MEYCVSAASMLAEEIWQIVEEFVEVPACRINYRNVEEIFQMINNLDYQSWKVEFSTLWKLQCRLSTRRKEWVGIFHETGSKMIYEPQSAKEVE